jgi:AraC-like DNA-binding protein
MRGRREQIHLPGGQSFRVLRWSQGVHAVEALLAPGSAVRLKGEGDHWHYHPAMELACFTTGEGTRFVGDHIAPFAGGDVVLLGEKLPHYWHAHGQTTGLAVQWHFPHGHPFWSFPETLALAGVFKEAARGLHYTGRTAAALTTALQALAHSAGPARLGQLLHLFALLAAAPTGEVTPLSSRAFALPSASVHQQAIGAAVRHLLANFRDIIRLDTVLRLTGMSKATFARQFKQHSGKTFSEFINQIRLQAACRELAETDDAVLEIALACGFTQVSFFNRLFRRVHRCSPTRYRAKSRRRPRH